MKYDPEKGAGWGIFKLPKDDPDQAGADEHDDDAERKARSLPTERSREEGNEALERAWEKERETILRPGQDAFARLWDGARDKLFRAFIWIFQKPLRGWASGRITTCELAERGECICLRDKNKFGNTP